MEKKKFHSKDAKKRIGIGNKKAYTNPLLRKYLSDIQKGQHHSIKTEFKKGHKYISSNHKVKHDMNKYEGEYSPKTKHTHYTRDWQREKRREVIETLGGKCVKCEFSDWRALQIDHVNGGGRKELQEVKMGTSSYYKKVREDETGSYQLLCANCNWIKKYENDEVSHKGGKLN